MIIRKTQQPSDFPTNSISNAKTTGTTNTYSCDYINDTIDNSKLKQYLLPELTLLKDGLRKEYNYIQLL